MNLLLTLIKRRRAAAILGAAGIVAAAIAFSTIRTPPIPQRTLRIGFEQVPPVQIRTDSGFAGLAVETVSEAAKRAGLSIAVGRNGYEFRRVVAARAGGPLADHGRPAREAETSPHNPAMAAHQSHSGVARSVADSGPRICRSNRPLSSCRFTPVCCGKNFPEAQLVQFADSPEVVKEVCRGTVFAAFLEDRALAHYGKAGRMRGTSSRPTH